MVGAAAVRPSPGPGGSAFGGIAQGATGAMGYEQQQQLAQNLQFRQAEEQRMQQQAAEQTALARKYNAQADKPTPPQMWQFGNLMYTHDPDRGFEVAKDTDGNPLEAPSNKTGKAAAAKKSVPGTPGYQGDPETGDITPGTIPMPASARASLPQNVAAGSPLSGVPGINEPAPPEQDLPSTLQAEKDAAAAQKQTNLDAKDTKPRPEKTFTQTTPGGPKKMVAIDMNPSSPTYLKPTPVPGVTEYEKPDKPDVVGPRLIQLQKQRATVEGLVSRRGHVAVRESIRQSTRRGFEVKGHSGRTEGSRSQPHPRAGKARPAEAQDKSARPRRACP